MTSKARWSVPALICAVFCLLLVACSEDEPTEPADDQCTITVTSPTKGEVLVPGNTTIINWTAPSNITQVRITMFRGELEVGEIIAVTENNGTYSWVVEDFGAGFGTGYFIQVAELTAHNICTGVSEMLILQAE